MHRVLKRNFEAFSACDWPAALTAHTPVAREHLGRDYGWYSNVSRRKRQKASESVVNRQVQGARLDLPQTRIPCNH